MNDEQSGLITNDTEVFSTYTSHIQIQSLEKFRWRFLNPNRDHFRWVLLQLEVIVLAEGVPAVLF